MRIKYHTKKLHVVQWNDVTSEYVHNAEVDEVEISRLIKNSQNEKCVFIITDKGTNIYIPTLGSQDFSTKELLEELLNREM